jgi:hypothetical protein
MDFVFDLLQGIGIAVGLGLELPIAGLLAIALARGDVGIDYDHTDFSFLESPVALAVLLLLAVVLFVARRRGTYPGHWVIPAVAGAVFAAGTLAEDNHNVIPGIVLGAGAGALGYLAATSLFERVRRRLDAEAARMLPVYSAVAALLATGLSVLAPPVAILIVAGLAWLLFGGRRREGEKYAGLRILR